MIEVTEALALQMSGTNRLVCLEALKRGWKVKVPYVPSGQMFFDRGDGRDVHVFSAVPPATSYADAHLADDKYATYIRLVEANIPQLESVLVGRDESLQDATDLIDRVKKVVVKPVDGGHGKGITVNVSSEQQLSAAVEVAKSFKKSISGVLVQEQFEADEMHDIRVAVIDGKFVAALERVPARVFGDGEHTVGQLIELENNKPERGGPYRAKLARIDITAAQRYLGGAIENIPAAGEEVRVLGVANYGAGGELVDVTDDVPSWMRDEAVQAAKTLKLSVPGVDYMVDRPLLASYGREDIQAVIVEVNKSPSLAIHDEPTVGQSRDVIPQYLDFIASL